MENYLLVIGHSLMPAAYRLENNIYLCLVSLYIIIRIFQTIFWNILRKSVAKDVKAVL